MTGAAVAFDPAARRVAQIGVIRSAWLELGRRGSAKLRQPAAVLAREIAEVSAASGVSKRSLTAQICRFPGPTSNSEEQ